MSLEEMLLRSELKRETPVPGEIARMIETVHRRLHDARHPDLHAETRLEQAYHAILGCALIALRINGYRVSDRRGHHGVALESLSDTVDLPMERIDYYQTLRTLRNKDLYTGGSHVTASAAEEAVQEAIQLTSELEQWFQERKDNA